MDSPKMTSDKFSNKNVIIIILLFTILVLLFGYNFVYSVSGWLKNVIDFFYYSVVQILNSFGYVTGNIIDKSSDVVSNSSKTGIDLIDGAIHSIGNLLISFSNENKVDLEKVKQQGKKAEEKKDTKPVSGSSSSGAFKCPDCSPVLNCPEHKKESMSGLSLSPYASTVAQPDSTTNPIQNPIASSKVSWCLVGEYQSTRGCISVDDDSKCMSGQIFPDQQTCLNPTLSNNMSQLKLLKGIPE